MLFSVLTFLQPRKGKLEKFEKNALFFIGLRQENSNYIKRPQKALLPPYFSIGSNTFKTILKNLSWDTLGLARYKNVLVRAW